MLSGTPLGDSLALLATRRYGTFWAASLLSNIGTWAQLVAQPWLLLSLGASSTLLGLDTFAMSAPAWLLMLPGGILADRRDRRWIIGGFQSVQMLCPVAIIVLLATGGLRPWIVIALSLVIGITDALSMPAFASIVPSLVQPGQVGAGLALNATQFNISRIAGPALAGVLMASLGAMACFVASAVSYVPFIAVAWWVLPRRSQATQSADTVSWRQALAGLGEMLQMPALRGALLTTFVSGLLCGPVITFCPVLIRSGFDGTAGQFSAAVAAFGLGGVLGAASLLAVDAARDRRRLSSWAAAGYGLALMLVALTPSFALVVAVLSCAGIAMSVANTSANTVVQSAAPAAMRGRAVSAYMLAMRGSIAIGALLTGLSVSAVGVRRALLINGVLAILGQLAIGRRWVRGPYAEPAAVV